MEINSEQGRLYIQSGKTNIFKRNSITKQIGQSPPTRTNKGKAILLLAFTNQFSKTKKIKTNDKIKNKLNNYKKQIPKTKNGKKN